MASGSRLTEPKAGFDGDGHQITHILALMPSVVATKLMASRSQHIECEGDRTFSPLSQLSFEAVRAPAQVGTVDSDATIVTTLIMPPALALQGEGHEPS